ncbi:MAG TPA: hypothetical protein VFJ07_05580 [Streptosporangiaceae bacterium]|nr:hypothetical protein [Streptosporangiaceae bacterium]
MPIPQVNDRIKEAPVVVLRAVFAGIGQILLTADKVRTRAAEQVWTPDRVPAGLPADRRTPEPPGNGTTRTEPAVTGYAAVREAPMGQAQVAAATPPATKTPPTAKAPPGTKATPATKASRPVKASSTAKSTSTAKAPPAAKATRAARTAPETKTPQITKAAKSVPAPRAAKAEPAAEAPPLPGYDDLSLASLRARLRVLDAPAIQMMLAYEKAHARREPVITMLERRLAKISAG